MISRRWLLSGAVGLGSVAAFASRAHGTEAAGLHSPAAFGERGVVGMYDPRYVAAHQLHDALSGIGVIALKPVACDIVRLMREHLAAWIASNVALLGVTPYSDWLVAQDAACSAYRTRVAWQVKPHEAAQQAAQVHCLLRWARCNPSAPSAAWRPAVGNLPVAALTGAPQRSGNVVFWMMA